MTDCRFSSSCSSLMDFLSDEPALAWIYRHRYCRGDQRQCARYRLAASGTADIPALLLPNERHSLTPVRVVPEVREVTTPQASAAG